MVRELIPIEAHRLLWTECHSLDGAVEELHPDCKPGLDNSRVIAILDTFRAEPELAKYLNYWVVLAHKVLYGIIKVLSKKNVFILNADSF